MQTICENFAKKPVYSVTCFLYKAIEFKGLGIDIRNFEVILFSPAAPVMLEYILKTTT
jgi:hypothetical protein